MSQQGVVLYAVPVPKGCLLWLVRWRHKHYLVRILRHTRIELKRAKSIPTGITNNILSTSRL